MIYKVLTWFFSRYSINHLINKMNEDERVILCNKSVSNSGAKFYPDAIVYNAANNPHLIQVGKNTHIRGTLLVFKYGGSIEIGNNCYVGDNSRIWSGNKIKIGNNVLISHNVNIVDTNSHELNSVERADRHVFLQENGPWSDAGSILSSPITIGDYAWISFNVVILKGVTIGKGAIVAAGSIVTKDVPDYAVVAGNPARIVSYSS